MVSRSKTLAHVWKTAIGRDAFQLTHDDSRERTLFASNVDESATLEQLQALFGSVEGVEVQLVRMRRDRRSKQFIGVFVSTNQAQLQAKLVQTVPWDGSSNMLTRGVSQQTASTPRATQKVERTG